MSRFRRVLFDRHSNPWSAWTRWASTPLVLVPVWTRRWRDAALVSAWLLVNPVIFPEPASDENWATRAILGEELWITQRPRDAAQAVSALTSVAAVCAIVAARRHRLGPAVTATAVQMALTLVYWQMMARYRDRQHGVAWRHARRFDNSRTRAGYAERSTLGTTNPECRRSIPCARRSRRGTAPPSVQQNSTPKPRKAARSKSSTRPVSARRLSGSPRSANRCSRATTECADSAVRSRNPPKSRSGSSLGEGLTR